MEFLPAVLAVAVLGGLGSVLRQLMSLWTGFLPWGILAANSLASFAAGASLATGFYELALVVGLAGGLSTFSTFAAQSYQLLTANRPLAAVGNALLNLLVPAGCLLTALILL